MPAEGGSISAMSRVSCVGERQLVFRCHMNADTGICGKLCAYKTADPIRIAYCFDSINQSCTIAIILGKLCSTLSCPVQLLLRKLSMTSHFVTHFERHSLRLSLSICPSGYACRFLFHYFLRKTPVKCYMIFLLNKVPEQNPKIPRKALFLIKELCFHFLKEIQPFNATIPYSGGHKSMEFVHGLKSISLCARLMLPRTHPYP
jgi:hypothetical protein